MTRERAKIILPLIQAYADGAEIEMKWSNGTWETIKNPAFDNSFCDYRVKPKKEYRPFIFEEMKNLFLQKRIILKNNSFAGYSTVDFIDYNGVYIRMFDKQTYEELLSNFKIVLEDGTLVPAGVLDEN